MRIFSGLAEVGEQKVLIQMRKLISNAQNASKLLYGVLDGSSSLERIHELKSESYEEVVNFSNTITSGAVSPNVIPDMLQLVELEYKITDMIFVLARSFTRYKLINPAQNKFVRLKIKATNELAEKALGVLYDMHSAGRIEDIKRMRGKVRIIEEEGDEVKEEMLNYAYSTKTDFKAFYHLINLSYISDDVLDNCEDTADVLMNIVISVAT